MIYALKLLVDAIAIILGIGMGLAGLILILTGVGLFLFRHFFLSIVPRMIAKMNEWE
jgi:hypothetical protein